jgi:hypothetical protein
VQLAAVELERVVEGTVGGILLAVALAWCALAVLPRWRARRAEKLADPGTPALARASDVDLRDPEVFGGGARVARSQRRRDTVAYGYLAAAEEYADPDTGAKWCTLTVSLPGRVPFLVVDHWQAVGQPGVPHGAPQRFRLDDPRFDSAYVVSADTPGVAERVLSPAVRDFLVDRPVQRLQLRGSTMMIRTFDGVELRDVVIRDLGDAVTRVLRATPAFVQSTMAVSGPLRPEDPLPEGLYGPDVE